MKHIQIHLTCKADYALQLIKENTDSLSLFRFPKALTGPNFWREIRGDKIEIWSKGPLKDISSPRMECKIENHESGAVIHAKLNDGFLQIPFWVSVFSLILGIFISGISIFLLFTLNSLFVPFFFGLLVCFGIFLFGFHQLYAKEQRADLENFLFHIFRNQSKEQKTNEIIGKN